MASAAARRWFSWIFVTPSGSWWPETVTVGTWNRVVSGYRPL